MPQSSTSPAVRANPVRPRLCHFFLGVWGFVLVLLFEGSGTSDGGVGVLAYRVAVAATYALLYLLPALAATGLVGGWLARRARRGVPVWWVAALVRAVAMLGSVGTELVLLADERVFAMYGFHLNGFVWNLATTRGGLESLGAGASTYRSVAMLVALLLAAHATWLWLCGRPAPARLTRFVPGRAAYRYLGVGLFVLALGERIAYGVSEVRAYTPVLVTADAFPFYSRLTFRRLAERLGLEARRAPDVELGAEGGRLVYPLAPLEVERPARPLNVVWLVAESLRADALTPEIMPASSAFAARAIRATRHYSGGNGTRMGMFSMFTGLHGAYWFSFLRERRGPVLFDALAEQDYQWELYTSARFTYPEFDRTLFARIPREHLHECADGLEWERDRANTRRLLDFVAARDRSRPFFAFQFFESPHARYHFPPESVVREPYLADFDYATTDVERDIELIRARYLNSCNHLDSQWARVLAFLEGEDLLDSTLVVLTGDHGEEFMEKGRWGHNSEFVEEQVRVPLVLWVPGEPARALTAMTSHVDLVATLLPRLGVVSPVEDYALGRDLLGAEQRPFQAVSDWSRIAYLDEDAKIAFALKGAGLFRQSATTLDDRPLDAEVVLAAKRSELLALMRELARFRRTSASSVP